MTRRGEWRKVALDGLLAVALAWFSASLWLSGWGADWPLNSDGVMPYVLFDDLFVHGARASAWIYPVAPYWLPDQLLAWAIYASTADLFRSVFLYATIQYALGLLAARWVFVELDAGLGRPMWWSWAALWTALAWAGASRPGGWYASVHGYVFYPYIHAGTLVATLAALGLLLRGYRTQRGTGLAALALLCLAMLVSDQVFIVWFLTPAILALAWPGLPKARWRVACIGILAATFVAYRIARVFGKPFLGAGAADTLTGNRAERALAAAAQMGRDVVRLAQLDAAFAVYEGIAVAAVAGLLVHAFRRRSERPAPFVFAVFVAASIILPLGASIMTARHEDAGHFRYVQTIGLAGMALVLLARPAIARLGRAGIAVPAAVLALVVAACVRGEGASLGSPRVHDARAPQLACEKDVFARYDVRTGYAEYWRAMSVMARVPGLNIVPLFTREALPHTGVNMNFDWLGADRALRHGTFEFVDEGDLDPAKLDILFGAPDERVACPESALRLYRVRPEREGLLTRFYRQYPRVIFRRLDHTGETDVPGALWAVAPGVADGDSTLVRGDLRDWTTVLSSSIEVRPGPIALWMDVASDGAAGAAELSYELLELNERDWPVGTLASGVLALEPGGRRVPLLSTTLPPEAGGVGLIVKLRGRVDARVDAVGWSR